jgi:hypothetical protein
VQAGQATTGQAVQPFLRHGFDRSGRFALAEAGGVDRAREGPGDEFGVQFPANAERAQVHSGVGGLRVGLRQVAIAQQCRHMGAAGFALAVVPQHDDMGNRQRRGHGLRGPAWTSLCSATRCGYGLLQQHGS